MLSGLLFGLATSAVNHGLGPDSDYLSKVLGNDWAWLVGGFTAAWPASSWRATMSRGCRFLYAAVLGYYLSDVRAGTYTTGPDLMTGAGMGGLDISGLTTDLIFYLLASTATAAVLALLTVTIRRGGPRGILAALVLPTYIARTALDRRVIAQRFPTDPVMATVSQHILWVAVAAIAVILAGAARLSLGSLRNGRF